MQSVTIKKPQVLRDQAYFLRWYSLRPDHFLLHLLPTLFASPHHMLFLHALGLLLPLQCL